MVSFYLFLKLVKIDTVSYEDRQKKSSMSTASVSPRGGIQLTTTMGNDENSFLSKDG